MNKIQTFFDRFEKNSKKLTKKQYSVAEYILKNYKTAVFLSSIDLGKQVGTSEATVIRLANALGYSGYLEMVKDIQDYIRREITTIDKVENIENSYKSNTTLDQIIDNNLSIVKSIKQYVSNEDISRIVKDIKKYKKIVIVGFETSSGIAEYIGYNLVRIVPDVEIVTHSSDNLFNIVSNADKNTFIIVLSFPRYSKNVVKLTKLFRKNNAKILSVTDSILSPIKKYSDHSIIIPLNNTNTLYQDVTVGIMTIFQAIFLQYVSNNREGVHKRLKELEEFNQEYEMFIKEE